MVQYRMLITHTLFPQRKHACLAFCILLAFTDPMNAAPRDITAAAEEMVSKSNDGKSIDYDQDIIPLRKFKGPISIEDSIRLRRDLDEYSRTVDPAHVQIEERRRIMYQRIQTRFADSDKDNDGSLSREEATESLPQVARHFGSVDTNNDGVLSLDELEALQFRIVERQRSDSIKIEPVEPESSSKRKSKDAMLTNRKRTL